MLGDSTSRGGGKWQALPENLWLSAAGMVKTEQASAALRGSQPLQSPLVPGLPVLRPSSPAPRHRAGEGHLLCQNLHPLSSSSSLLGEALSPKPCPLSLLSQVRPWGCSLHHATRAFLIRIKHEPLHFFM